MKGPPTGVSPEQSIQILNLNNKLAEKNLRKVFLTIIDSDQNLQNIFKD